MGDIIFFRAWTEGFLWHGRGILLADRVFDSTLELHKDPSINRDFYREIESAIKSGVNTMRLSNGVIVRWKIAHPWDLPEGGELPEWEEI